MDVGEPEMEETIVSFALLIELEDVGTFGLLSETPIGINEKKVKQGYVVACNVCETIVADVSSRIIAADAQRAHLDTLPFRGRPRPIQLHRAPAGTGSSLNQPAHSA